MQVEENVLLAPFTTFQIGGPARYYARVTSEAALREALTLARKENLPTFLLGGGSNLLIADEGFPGLVVHLALTPSMELQENRVEVSAGTSWEVLVDDVCGRGLYGMECLAGIPGLTGASPIQNIGAYGQEVAQTIERVSAIDLQTLEPITFSNDDCRFAYRTSLFNSTHRNRYVITAVWFRLSHTPMPLTYAELTKRLGDRQTSPAETASGVREIRRGKGMIVLPNDPDSRSAGSFFKNPVVPFALLNQFSTPPPNWPVDLQSTKLPAAWLVEKAGFYRGFQLGQAGISSRHTLALINRTGHALCADILHLRDTVVSEVYGRYGIRLEQEPVFLHKYLSGSEPVGSQHSSSPSKIPPKY